MTGKTSIKIHVDTSEIDEAAARLERLAALVRPRVTHGWGLREGEWWLVVYHDGEPHEAYHQRHGRIEAHRDTFTHWSLDDAPPET
jgi:hypothetical protein